MVIFSMEFNSVIESDNMSLSLISQFCDSKLAELTGKSPSESDVSEKRNSLYSDIFSGSSSSTAMSYKPKRREHCSTSSAVSDNEPIANCSDFADPLSQQLRIKRKIPISKHIKPHKMVEFLKQANCNDNVEDTEGCYQAHDISSSISFVKDRLSSYLPALKRQVHNGKWSYLKALPSLDRIIVGSEDSLYKSQNGYCHTDTRRDIYKWDCDQGFKISTINKLMVFFGVISKSNSVQLSRLKKLFAHAGVASLPLQSMTANRKRLFLQDGTGRIELNDLPNKLPFKKVVSGIPVAIIGSVNGTMIDVEDVFFATPCAPEWPIPSEDGIEMVFISGLYFGSEDNSSLALDLLQDYLLGLAGSATEQKDILAPRLRLFLVGNLISKSVNTTKSSLDNVTTVCAKNMEKLDYFLEPLVRIMEVFLIPGENDLTFDPNLPHPPLHPKMLPESSKFRSLKLLTNPAKIQVSVSQSISNTPPKSQDYSECSLMMDSSFAELLRGEVEFVDLVLQSGKNVKHTMEYCDISCPIEMGQSLLKWAHLHPTSCNTNTVLAEQLFSLRGSSPHIMVIGNLSEFQTTDYNGTKIIGIPSFQKTSTAVVLTKNFDAIPLSFKLL